MPPIFLTRSEWCFGLRPLTNLGARGPLLLALLLWGALANAARNFHCSPRRFFFCYNALNRSDSNIPSVGPAHLLTDPTNGGPLHSHTDDGTLRVRVRLAILRHAAVVERGSGKTPEGDQVGNPPKCAKSWEIEGDQVGNPPKSAKSWEI
jgi:hypothetical protein